MKQYAIPTSVLLANDSGTGIKVISVGQPFNGQTLLGTVSLSGTTVHYTPPPDTVIGGGQRDSNVLQRSGSFGIGSGYGLAQGGGVSADLQVGDLCVLVFFCKVADRAAVLAALEPGWTQVSIAQSTSRTVAMFTRTADADYVAVQHQPRYVGNYAEFYPFFTTNAYRTSGYAWTFSFRLPDGVALDDFIQALRTDASDGPHYATSMPTVTRPAYRYTYFDALGTDLQSTYSIPPQPANALTYGVSNHPTQFNMELTGDCDPGAYPDTATVDGTSDAVFWSFVINETAGGTAVPTANSDVFGYVISDTYGQTAMADVFLTLASLAPLANTSNSANTVSGPVLG